jgi:hypothetical protein
MIPQSSTSIALEGIGFADSTLIATLGYSVFSIEIVVPNPVYPEILGGGFGVKDTRPYVSKTPKSQKVTTRSVMVKVTLNGKTTTRTYMVRTRTHRAVVSVVNIINSTSKLIQVGISNIKRKGVEFVEWLS